ncbi:hypothetical protein M413DRAFT_81422 [Hebeloma cylindrosporum]|uniref:C3H1-type domain-containing protein n=1 Tax=Hebeloma cylindrosporum TaxID=76867 RepID=A0A0C3CWP8_HEBCY|nr:hypothetical protein M413DRAFT_81422 [Hebeloma cylindrosporum h7]
MIPRRCRYFDNDGEPVGAGCRHPSCGFVHPGDRDWDTALPTYKAYPHDRGRGSFRGRRDGGWKDARSPTSPSLRRDSQKTFDFRDRDASRRPHSRSSRYSRSSSRSPPRGRRSSIASSKDAEAGPSRIAEVAMNIDPPSLPTPPATAPMDHTTFSAQAQNPPTGPSARRSSHHASPTPRTSSNELPSTPPPPPPPGPVPMNPPLPLPEVPNTLTLEVAQPHGEQTQEEKFSLWEGRIKSFAASVHAREQLTELEKEITAAQDVIASSYFQTFPENTKAHLADQLQELVKKRDAAKEECEQHVESLVQSGFWPVIPPTVNSETERMQKDHEEIVRYVKDLHQTANEMKSVLGEITELKQPPMLFLPDSSDEESEVDDIMDVDEENNPVASSSSKTLVSKPLLPTRRRKKDQSEKVGEPSPTVTQAELDEVLNQLANLEAIADTLQNDSIERDRELKDDFEQRLANAAEAINARRQEELQARDEKRRKHDAVTVARIKAMKEEVNVTGAQVGELAEDMGDILLKVDRLQAELESQKEERAESMKRLEEAQRQLMESKSIQRENSEKIATLKLAVQAYVARPASPPPTPTLPPPSFVLQALEEPLTQAVRTSVQPLVEELRNDVERLVKANNSELYSTVWEKVSHPLRVLELIRARVNGSTLATTTSTIANANAAPASTPAGGNPYPSFR